VGGPWTDNDRLVATLMPKRRSRCPKCQRVHTGPGRECHACAADREVEEDLKINLPLVAEQQRPKPDRAPREYQPKRVYTPEQRAEICEYARRHGVAQAHREFGTSESTIVVWMQDEVERNAAVAAGGEG
jgi:hypothetical protein